MKKIIFTLAAFGLVLTGIAQNEKPTKNETDPDSLVNKANYNTTRTSKTIKGPTGEGDKNAKKKKEEKVKVGKGGGQQSMDAPFKVLFHDKMKIERDLK